MRRILVVDNEKNIRFSVVHGRRGDTGRCCIEGLQMVREQDYDLLLSIQCVISSAFRLFVSLYRISLDVTVEQVRFIPTIRIMKDETPRGAGTGVELYEFMRHLAHELGNPVASIHMSAEMLQGDYPEAMKVELVDIILAESKRLETLIESAVYFSSISVPTTVDVEIQPLMEAIAGRAEPTVPVSIDVQSAPAEIRIDPTQLVRVLEELLCNSRDAGASRIDVVLRMAGATLHIAVADDGEGIVAERYANIYRPFYTTREGRLGLGLAIARRLVEQMNGTLEIVPNNSGGTVATLSLPATTQ